MKIDKHPSELEKGEIVHSSFGEQEYLYPIVYLGKEDELYKFYDVQDGTIKGYSLETWLDRGVKYDMVFIHTYGSWR